jgi:hypothetical protein
MSGIKIEDEHIELFNRLKIDKEYVALSFKLGPNRDKIELDQKFLKETDHESIINSLKDECIFLIYDFHFKTFENPPRDTQKIILVHYAPDNAPIKMKVPFSATKAELKSAFVGIQKDIQASDTSILDKEELRKECCS